MSSSRASWILRGLSIGSLTGLGTVTAPTVTLARPWVPLMNPVPFESILPDVTDRVFLVGQTGSGKTTLAEMLCRCRYYVVVFDPKGRIGWEGYEVHTQLASLVASSAARLIYRPVYEELQDLDEHGTVDQFFEWVYRRGHTTLYVDEVLAVAQGDMYPWHYGACITRGRELGIETYTATQRPARIPGIVRSEAEHDYIFKLRRASDRETMEEETGVSRDAIFQLPKHHFFYARQDSEAVGPLTLDLSAVHFQAVAS
jgi:energy-coupling factor transporter ATP-binding protein EcfA2